MTSKGEIPPIPEELAVRRGAGYEEKLELAGLEVFDIPENKFRFVSDSEDQDKVREQDPMDLAKAIKENEVKRVRAINQLVDSFSQVQVRADLEKDRIKAQLRALGWKARRRKSVQADGGGDNPSVVE